MDTHNSEVHRTADSIASVNGCEECRQEVDAIKATVREAMAEIGTSSLGHHKLRKIVPDWDESVR